MPESGAGTAAPQGHGGSPPVVSVVIPTRDRPALLRRAVASVRAQTLEAWELLVVDDGSDPPARLVLEEILEQDSRVRLLRLEESAGAGAARNRGIDAARCRYVAFLDDDDSWAPEFLDRMTRSFDAGGGADVAYCGLRIRQPDGGETIPRVPDLSGEDDPLSTLVRGNFIDTPTVIARRDALRRVDGFDESLPRLQDWDLWLRLAPQSRFVRVGEPLVLASTTPGGISSSPARMAEACEILARRRPRELKLDRRQQGDFFYTLATFLVLGGARQRSFSYFLRALAHRPWPPRRWAAAAAAMLAPPLYDAVTRRRSAAGKG